MRRLLIVASFALSGTAGAQLHGYESPYESPRRSYEPRMSLEEEARRERELGVEPLPGERTGIVGPRGRGSRLNEDYWERQRELDENVERARRRLERERERGSAPR
jgi:hypothetical protein